MLIAGLDLAAEPKGTALAVLDWSRSRVKLLSLEQNVQDQRIIDAASTLDKLGIDCALGWPVDFVDFLKRYSSESLAGEVFEGDIDWRRRLAHRETDREVHRVTGRWPLSVSTDRLGMTALRCAGLLSKLQASGTPIDRSGGGLVVEIYPAASMRIWGLQIAGYRNSESIRSRLINNLKEAAPWLELLGFEVQLVESCDAFDSVIAALAAGSAASGKSSRPPASKLAQAKVEGWVALPLTSVAELVSQ